jgi:hypothetical protein
MFALLLNFDENFFMRSTCAHHFSFDHDDEFENDDDDDDDDDDNDDDDNNEKSNAFQKNVDANFEKNKNDVDVESFKKKKS